MSPEKVKVAVVGLGQFGRNHARVYRTLEGAELVGVFDTDSERAHAVGQEFGAPVLDSLDAVARQAQAVSVAVPTAAHARVATELLRRGCDVLVEKPIAASLGETDELIATAQKEKRILEVGHTERFNPAVRAAAKIVTQPLFFEVHRLGVFSGRSLDVDVIFDLMIHDLDILLSFVPAPVERVDAVGIPILSSRVDIASVRLEFGNGCVANLTASRVSTDKVRKLRFFQPHQYISIDYKRQDVLVVELDKEGGGEAVNAGLAAELGLPSGLAFRKLETEKEEPLRTELRTFVESTRTRRSTGVNGEEARRALKLAEQVATGIAEHARKLPVTVAPLGQAGS